MRDDMDPIIFELSRVSCEEMGEAEEPEATTTTPVVGEQPDADIPF